MVAEREVQRRRGPDVALGVVDLAGQSCPAPADVQPHALPPVEPVLVPVVGRERECVAGQPAPERRQLERADGRSFARNPVDVARAARPTDGDEEDAPQGREHHGQVEPEFAVEALAGFGIPARIVVLDVYFNVVADVEIEEAVAVYVAPGTTRGPVGILDAGPGCDVDKTPAALAIRFIVVQDEAAPAGHEQVGPAVVVVVRNRAAVRIEQRPV